MTHASIFAAGLNKQVTRDDTKTYYLDIFDSRNTCVTTTIDEPNFAAARRRARYLSLGRKFPVVVKTADYRGEFAKYENGKCHEASSAAFLTN